MVSKSSQARGQPQHFIALRAPLASWNGTPSRIVHSMPPVLTAFPSRISSVPSGERTELAGLAADRPYHVVEGVGIE